MPKTILIVDDSKSVRAVIGTTLKMGGYNTITAEDGRDALTKLGQKDIGQIDLIITDVNMPNMDGLAFLQQVKRLPRYMKTPICVLTTESEQSKAEQELGALKDAWLTKPVQPAHVLDVVGELLNL
ncbi:MAG TPA: response regulator [Gammaproteobacteria bacterium]|nr:response regulator [Gammaproteobacteria bacterium]